MVRTLSKEALQRPDQHLFQVLKAFAVEVHYW